MVAANKQETHFYFTSTHTTSRARYVVAANKQETHFYSKVAHFNFCTGCVSVQQIENPCTLGCTYFGRVYYLETSSEVETERGK